MTELNYVYFNISSFKDKTSFALSLRRNIG